MLGWILDSLSTRANSLALGRSTITRKAENVYYYYMHKELYIIGYFCCCLSLYEVGNMTINYAGQGGGSKMECCISCGSTFTLNDSVLCQLTTRELEVSKKIFGNYIRTAGGVLSRFLY